MSLAAPARCKGAVGGRRGDRCRGRPRCTYIRTTAEAIPGQGRAVAGGARGGCGSERAWHQRPGARLSPQPSARDTQAAGGGAGANRPGARGTRGGGRAQTRSICGLPCESQHPRHRCGRTPQRAPSVDQLHRQGRGDRGSAWYTPPTRGAPGHAHGDGRHRQEPARRQGGPDAPGYLS